LVIVFFFGVSITNVLVVIYSGLVIVLIFHLCPSIGL